jgi:uncharacterized membrane protein YraQ (UPF0718 family)
MAIHKEGATMRWQAEWRPLGWIVAGFFLCYFLPVEWERFDGAVVEALALVRWYAREHVLLCLIPAFFIAGAIAVFIRQEAVMRYLGAGARKVVAYSVASVSGTILAVCSCTILPLFAGIYRMGAGLGPATAFLYSGPAINVLAIVLTARVLGWQLGVARAVGAIAFSVVVGLAMALLFRHEEGERIAPAQVTVGDGGRPLWQTALYFAVMVGVLVFANWGPPAEPTGVWAALYQAKWAITALFGLLLAVALVVWMGFPWLRVVAIAAATAAVALLYPGRPLAPFVVAVAGLSLVTATERGEGGDWFGAAWGFAKQILPLLLIGVVIAGLLLGRPGHEGLIPSGWVSRAVGGNTFAANAFASVAGAFMYFATLTEVPILEGLLRNGMGQGPALALLLAGPALSLPNMLVIRSVLGTKKTAAYVSLVVVMATISGEIYGALAGT